MGHHQETNLCNNPRRRGETKEQKDYWKKYDLKLPNLMKNTNIHVRLRHDRQPRLGVGRVTWLSGHLEPANQHAPSKKKGTYQGKVETPTPKFEKSPGRFGPIRLLCKHATNPLKPATSCLCTPYKLGNSLGSAISDPISLRWMRGRSPDSSQW